MTEEEYNELKKQYEEVDKEYQAIREKRALIKRKISWYEYSNEKLLHSYRQGLSYELFGIGIYRMNLHCCVLSGLGLVALIIMVMTEETREVITSEKCL